jgi:hypothetical protein
MRVKFFSQSFDDSPTKIEEEINKWLQDLRGIRILERQMSSACGLNADYDEYVNVTVAIWYEDK